MSRDDFWPDEGWINLGRYSDLANHGEASTRFLEAILQFGLLKDLGRIPEEGFVLPPTPISEVVLPPVILIEGIPVHGEPYDVNVVVQHANQTN